MASPPSQQDLASYMGTTSNGTDYIGLVQGALNHYLATSWYESKSVTDPPTQAQRDLLKQDVVYDVDRGYPARRQRGQRLASGSRVAT